MKTRIKEFREKKGITQERAADDLKMHHITYNRIENGKIGISLDKLQQIADYYECDPATLISDAAPTRPVMVKSHVQAGQWDDNHQWDESDWYQVAVPDDAELRPYALHAAEARGPSMNKRYPEGTILVFTSNIETMEDIQLGKRYIVERERTDGMRETTIKLLHRDETGKFWLIPESTDPLHQQPIELNGHDGDTIRIVGRVRYSVSRE